MKLFKTLVVEDNITFRQTLLEILSARFPFMVIEEAGDGREALQKADTFFPDLIFMDIKLPDDNGLELTQKIKAKFPEIVVIVLTGYDLPEYREASLRYADYFFSKDSSSAENIFTLIQSVL